MPDQTMDKWLDELASSAATPGGGAAAALQAAIGAALVSMVCNLTIGKPKYAEHEATMTGARDRATALRAEALALADADAAAFAAVIAAYQLPKATEADKQARTERIQAALVGAADVPLRTAAAAAEVVELAHRIADGANVNVLSDVAVAASSARAALAASVVNVEVNLAGLTDADQREAIGGALAQHTPALAAADALVDVVRERIRG